MDLQRESKGWLYDPFSPDTMNNPVATNSYRQLERGSRLVVPAEAFSRDWSPSSHGKST